MDNVDKNIVAYLLKKYGENILPVENLPKAYCPGGIEKVKAIYLGCDPSNTHTTSMPYAFAHKCGCNYFNSFINSHTQQLACIGLTWETVYTQNLCRNYFQKETSINLKLWTKAAKEFWIEELKEELSQFDLTLPVLLTSQYLLEVLGTGGVEKIKAPEFYTCKKGIPIAADCNLLGRDLIPLYRGKNPYCKVSYHLKNDKWNSYKILIENYIDIN
ncbi:MAG: hypothetical protein HYV28_18190 [Ignavibacteriales bacterium]|nr:hypothetical protein [Ignavibacteriales bacterium]